MNAMRPVAFKTVCDDGFTLIELLVVIGTMAILATLLLPALAGTKPNSQSFQCLENERQLILAWQMYAADNNDLLPPNDYPYLTTYYTAANKTGLRSWVVGTMAQPLDSRSAAELLDPNTLLSPYVTNSSVYRCPADNYIDPFSTKVHVRSYSMNSAVGTIWCFSPQYAAANGGGISGPMGAPVLGGWLPGVAYYGNQTTWLTYGKMSSFTRPGPANTFVIMDENPYSINDGSFAVSAVANPGATYLIDYPAGNHNGAAGISFADGHVIIHKWLDKRTYSPQGIISPGKGGTSSTLQTPDDPDCFYLAPLTSARR